jgi:hypothetical protein
VFDIWIAAVGQPITMGIVRSLLALPTPQPMFETYPSLPLRTTILAPVAALPPPGFETLSMVDLLGYQADHLDFCCVSTTVYLDLVLLYICRCVSAAVYLPLCICHCVSAAVYLPLCLLCCISTTVSAAVHLPLCIRCCVSAAVYPPLYISCCVS